MPIDDLIRDTNDLLRRFFELHERNLAEAEKSRREFEEQVSSFRQTEPERSEPAGTVEPVIEEENLQERFDRVAAESRRRIDDLRKLDSEYKEVLLAELRTQSDLLAQIAAKLNR